MSTPRVAIFRKRLLSYSETFIADQGQLLPTFSPLYCGFERDESGIELIADSDKLLLAEYSNLPPLAKLMFRKGIGSGGAWLRAIRQLNPALVHAHFFNDGLDALRLGEQLDVPVITTVHGHDITKHENVGAQSKTTARFFQQVDRIIAVSSFIAAQAIARGCPEDKLIQHYIGIDLEKFQQPKTESDRPSLLFVGRLVEKKGCTYLLQAMQKLQPRFPEIELTIVGDGDLRGALEAEAGERGLAVEFTGTESAAQIRERLARSWLFVAPSTTAASGDAEGLGMVFLESQALQTPVVSFRHGGVVEAVADGETGLLCDEKDVDALTDNITTLLENQDLRRQMGEAGRDRVEREFDVRRQCAKLEQIYAKLC